MRVHHVSTPRFKYNGEDMYTNTEMIGSFSHIDEMIKDKENEFGKDNVELVIFSISTIEYHNEIVLSVPDNKPIMFLRFKFTKTIPGAIVENYE